MRNATLDHARLIAAAGIVVFHSGAPGAAIGYAGLPFFLMLLMLLAWPAAERQPFGAFAGARVARLLVPWAVWGAIYGALKLAEVAVTGRPLGAEFAPWMLLTGPALHLWFLPFAAAICLVLWPLARGAATLDPQSRGMLAGLAAAVAVAALLVQQGADLPRPFAQWAEAAPAVALGTAMALAAGSRGAAALVAGAVAVLAVAGWPQGATQLALAGAALWLCLVLPLPETHLGSQAGRLAADLSLTVYVAHPLVSSMLVRATPLAEKSTGLALATVAATLVLALALWGAPRIASRLVPGIFARRAAAPPNPT